MEKVVGGNGVVNYSCSEELKEINASLEILYEWSDKHNFNIIFDSEKDGDGREVLANKVRNKKNLYFISFDNENNVFGGYLSEFINKTGWIKDTSAFVFSLIRNGKIENMKYKIKDGQDGNSFYLYTNCDLLYCFGYNDGRSYDVTVLKIGCSGAYFCNPCSYEYNGKQQPLRNNTTNYIIKRIVVLEMN
ncbi:TLDc domain-containing protein [Entamoeba marina]